MRVFPFPAAALLGAALVALPAGAVPRLDLSPYPAPAAGERRWVIQLPGVLPPAGDPGFSRSPDDWRVQLIVGKEEEVDCNSRSRGGRMRSETLRGWGYTVYRVSGVGPMVSTRMGCPADQPKRRAFVPVGSRPFVVPYNASLPIVVYAPRDLEVRWRLWKAETRQQRAQPL
jgi:ecotin